MKKEQVINKLAQAWDEFNESFAGLSDEQIAHSAVTGDWTVKDLIAHISWWEEEALKHLPHILQGITPPRYKDAYGGLDAFNAFMSEKKHSLSLDEIQKQAVESHHRLIHYLGTIPEEYFKTETRFRRRLRLDTYSHYPEHTQAIRVWRTKNGF